MSTSSLYFENQVVILNTSGYSFISHGDIELQQGLLASNITTGTLTIYSTQSSQNIASGALVVNGGISTLENLNVGGYITQNSLPVLPDSLGDIKETSAIFTNNSNNSPITGLLFQNSLVESFTSIISVNVFNSSGNLYAKYTLEGIQTSDSWFINQRGIGDILTLNIDFDIDNTGQITYNSPNFTDFLAGTFKFRAITTTKTQPQNNAGIGGGGAIGGPALARS